MKIHTNGINQDEKINFPVQYDLKVIMDSSKSDDEHQTAIKSVLDLLHISHTNWRNKKSGKGNYTSYSISIYVLSQDELTLLYNKLKDVPGIKMAI